MNIENLTIKKLQEGYKKKDFSVTEIVKTYLDRIKKKDKALNSFITVCEIEAIKQAKNADKIINNRAIEQFNNYPLIGVPLGLKDLYSTKGIKTTAASKVLEDYIPSYDATVVKKYKNSGAIIIGKLNCDAWAHGSSGENSDYKPAKNPWNLEYTPGGSSSGSAVSVSASLTLVSAGTDTGGSIRLPASFTNTVGIKPTYGLVSRYGIISMASSLDTIGHFTKTVKDNASVLNITAGGDEFDATTMPQKKQDYKKELEKGIKGLKIGIPKEYIEKGIDKDVKNVFEKSIKIFQKLGAEIEEISLPHTKYAVSTYYIIQPSEVSSNLARYDGIRYGNDRSFFGDEAKRRIMLGSFSLSSGYYDAYYKKAMQVRTLIKNDFENSFAKIDAIITPVSPTPPWKLGEKINDPLKMYLSDILTISTNLAGIPGLALPAGFSSTKLPVGIQILGTHFSEQLLYRIGYAFEQETQCYKINPKL